MALRTRSVLSRLLPVLAVTVFTATACSGDGAEEGRTAAKPTYELPPRPVRNDGEKAVKAPTARSGETAFTVIGYTGGMPELVGSHADVRPKGQYVRVRLVVENTGRTGQTFVPKEQSLVLASGRTITPDREAMLVKRMPEQFPVGAGMRVELDIWYDVPRTERPAAIRFQGEPGVGAVSEPAPVDVKLP
ncbi:hypothetical protein Acsp03_11690 [Actinomadura sp. NBRC 104412]|uniref:DUF4352 domain-containing protein n=1 Tax=Actinomadura sp. NBRC 104412 TaxID=3032203 RepID=UPI0024A41FF7|nr:DUF4352 domain-containing protein [Actinomadura sp. NBRC 104412]GLZ03702.1 hypothetical protein Acsp03_11690 [Actinomadura sp. NBRC 104412]